MRMPFELPATDRASHWQGVDRRAASHPGTPRRPVQVLANLHTATDRLNAIPSSSNGSDSPAIDLETIASLVPPTVAQVGMQLYTRSGLRRRLKPICHGSVSYIAVEPVPAYCAGGEVIGMHTVAPLSEESGLNIALTSRGEQLDVSVCACPDNVPGVDDIATGIAHFVDVLMAAARNLLADKAVPS